jgi:flavin reductase (DIM6/NTAB) family NADH-FMN oxidoreductase RutF
MPSQVDALTMRETMGRFATGVAVITTAADGEPHGMTMNSLTSVSLDPPLLLVCFNHGARTLDAVRTSGTFVVNILARRQREVAMRFAQRGESHFEGLDLEYGDHAVPVVPRALAHLECDVHQLVEAGDHAVVLGQVTRTCLNDGQPLAFYGGRFGDITTDHEVEHWFF